MSERFGADWLALREPFDAAARSRTLAERLAACLPVRPRLLDLGAGTFSLFRWLAPIIGRAQVWTLADADAALLHTGFTRTAHWAAQHGWTATFPGRAMLVHTPHGAWRLEALQVDLANAPRGLPLDRVDAVVCSALLDLVSDRWLRELAGALLVPLLATLTVDGRDAFLPPHPQDPLVRAGFRRDQGRDKGFGPALGPRAPAALMHALGGFALASAPSDWRLPRGALGILRALVQGHADAACTTIPARQARLGGWRQARLGQAASGRLAIRIGHRDILAIPGRM